VPGRQSEFAVAAAIVDEPEQGEQLAPGAIALIHRVRIVSKNFRFTWNIRSFGYSPDATLHRELQIQECPTTLGPIGTATALAKQGGDGLAAAPLGPAALRTPEPNFFVLGAKSYGRNGQFLLRSGFEQVQEVFALINGKADLNLYGR
jgi:hypothetical protein